MMPYAPKRSAIRAVYSSWPSAAAAFLFRLMGRAREAGAGTFRVTLRPTDANLEMRILLRQAGLRRTDDTPGGAPDSAVLARPLHGDLPEPPPYLHVSDREDTEA